MFIDLAEAVALGEGDLALLDLLQGGGDIAVHERLLLRVREGVHILSLQN